MLIKEASQKWNISERRIRKLIELGRINNATKLGNIWTIPDDTSKPIDKRYKIEEEINYDIDENLFKEIESKLNLIYKSRFNDRHKMNNLKNKIDQAIIYHDNSYTKNRINLNEIRIVLEGITVPGKTIEEHLEITNYYQAIKYLENTRNITEETIKDIYKILKNRLSNNEALYQNNNTKNLIDETIQNYNDLKEYHPLIASAYLHGKILKIKPFQELNLKIAKLLLNCSLINNGYSPIIITKNDRFNYFDSIEEIINNNDYTNLIKFITKKESEVLEEYIKIIKF